MKKAGIITLYYKNDNYGGIAQGYALQQYINTLGIDSELISYQRTPAKILSKGEELKKLGVKGFVSLKADCFFKKTKVKLKNKNARKKYGLSLKDKLQQRKDAFEVSREEVPHSPVYTEDNIINCSDRYDYFISGSDQIWKPGVLQPPYIFTFLPENKVRFSYASSITTLNNDKEYDEKMKNALEKYKWISVREESGQKYLEKLLNRNVDLVVDPTFLLSKEQWEEYITERQIKEKYVFTYFLGQSTKQRKIVEKYAKENNLKIVSLPHVEGKIYACDINFGDIQLYDVNVRQFLSLIKYAEVVFTDSFHAGVFSNIFETQYWIFEREVFSKKVSMNSRLDTLLALLGEEDRKVREYTDIHNNNIDFENAKAKLNVEIDKSKELLKKALDL